LGALVLSVVLLTLSPALSLQKVVVEGAERLQPGEVAQALNSLQGEPLARVSTERVGNALAPLSLIQAFETRIEPPGTLVVTIVERKPIGAVAQGSQYSVVDAAGVKLWESAASPLDLPIILVAADQNSPSYGAVSRVLLALPDELLSRVDAITATTLDDVRFSIRGASHEVVWGSSNRAREKARVLTAALRAAGSDPSQIIDVTTPESVVIRAKG
jgi:cell division protein FtsQ